MAGHIGIKYPPPSINYKGINLLYKTADYEITADDLADAHTLIVMVNTSGGDVDIKLPTFTNFANKIIHVIMHSLTTTYNTLNVTNNNAVSKFLGYSDGDFFKVTTDGTTLYYLGEHTTVQGYLAKTADQSVGITSNVDLFTTNYSVEQNIGGWYDSTTNHRLDIAFNCLIEINPVYLVSHERISSNISLNGTLMYDIQGSIARTSVRDNTLEFSLGNYLKFYASNSDGDFSGNILGDAAKDETRLYWRVIRRLRR